MFKFGVGAINKRMRQYFICLVAVVVVVFYILCLTGCLGTSPGIPGIFVAKLYNNETGAEVRIGLFGLCAGNADNLTCAAALGKNLTVANASSIEYMLPGAMSNLAASDDLQSLLALATAMQTSQSGAGGVTAPVFVPLILGCLFFVAAVGALLAHGALNQPEYSEEEGKYYESAHSARAWELVGVVTTYSVAAALAAAIATTTASRALLYAGNVLPGATLTSDEATSSGTIQVKAGTALPVLQWLVVALTLMWHLLMTSVWQRM